MDFLQSNDLFYIVVILSLIVNFFCIVINKYNSDKQEINDIFVNKWSNLLYFLSFKKPFVWFIDNDEENPKTKEVIKNLKEAHLTHVMNYRVFTVAKFLLVTLDVLLFFVIMFVIKNIHTIFYFLFRTEIAPITGQDLKDLYVIVILILLATLIIPNSYIKKKATESSYGALRDIPLIQMFIILMLRSNKTTSEIFYGLSQINTCYREIFYTAYLKYIRNSNECFDFLEETFKNTEFEDSLRILKSLPDYSKKDTIEILENQMNSTVAATTNKKRRKDVSGLVLSQATVMFPFIAFCILVLVPIAMYGISLLNNSMNSF